ncbi:MAG: helix-hairpin-helix domain-containing protein [Bacteroides sp.]|nr:helix-hairpin-helix domain-containing protein [Bacteroides sp.]
MRNPFREFIYFSRAERRGVVVLIAGIVLVFLSGHVYSYWRERQPLSEEEMERQAAAIAEYKSFLASLQEKEAEEKERDHRFRHSSKEQPPAAVLAPFDPNTADSAAFCRLGLPGWMARNILRYRDKGGKFRQAEDFKKIYGMTKEQFQILLPYIRIAPEESEEASVRLYNPPANSDSAALLQTVQEKYPEGTVIDLNRVDTTELKRIPGIGSSIARLIVGQRQRLGGFYSITQLEEVHLDAARLQPWFSIDTTAIRLLNLNRAGIEQLRAHPYINFYQAKAFVEYRKKRGKLHSLKPFILYEEFTETDLERIGHYVCFE